MLTRCQEHCSAARECSRNDVGDAITNHKAARQIQAMILRRRQNHAGFRLPTLTINPVAWHCRIRVVGTIVNCIEFRGPRQFQQIIQISVDAVNILFQNQSSRYDRLICDEDESEACPSQARERSRNVLQDTHLLRLGQQVYVFNENAIPIQENRWMDWMHTLYTQLS